MELLDHQDERRNAIVPGEKGEDLRNELRLQRRLEMKRQNGMKPNVISVKLPTYDVINVRVSIVPGFLIRSLKSFLNEAVLQRGFAGISPERMRLLHAGRELLDEWEVLDCNIDDKHTLDMVLRMQPVSVQDSHVFQPAASSTLRSDDDDDDDDQEEGEPVLGFTENNYEYREFLRNSTPQHNAENVPINTRIKLVFGPNARGVHLVLPAMLESSDLGWEHYLQSLGGLTPRLVPTAAASKRVDAKNSHASTPGDTSPQKDKVYAEPKLPTLDKPGDMPRHFGNALEAARSRGFVKWTHEKLDRRVFVVEADLSIYNRVPSMSSGANASLLEAMLRSDQIDEATATARTTKDKGNGKDSDPDIKLFPKAKESKLSCAGFADDEASVTGSVGSVATKASFNPNSSTAGLEAVALAKLKESRAQAAARDAALDEIRYNWKGINGGYSGGDACSWQRYTHELPVETRTELRGRKAAHEDSIAAPAEVPLLQHLFGYQPPPQATYDSYVYAMKAAEGAVKTVLLLPPVQHPGNIPTKDEVLGLRLGQRKTAAAPQWPSTVGHPPATGQVLADTPSHWLHTLSARDDDRTYELVLTPTEPLKYDTEYFIVLANGVPVLPAGDVLAAAYGFAAAGQICEDYIIRFRTASAPPLLSKKEAKALRKDLRRNAINNLKMPLPVKKVWVDLKTIDWDALNEWPKPKPPCVEGDGTASEYTEEFDEEGEDEDQYKNRILKELDHDPNLEADHS